MYQNSIHYRNMLHHQYILLSIICQVAYMYIIRSLFCSTLRFIAFSSSNIVSCQNFWYNKYLVAQISGPNHRRKAGIPMKNMISVRGARENNLKNVNIDLPRDQLVVLTGLSGSGKSSLAFDTIYAEGRRRYVESLSSYARQHRSQASKKQGSVVSYFYLHFIFAYARISLLDILAFL